MIVHRPVMLSQAVDGLITNADGVYVDATFGRGGHSRLILSKLSEKGKLIALDKDPEAIAVGRQMEQEDARLLVIHKDFSEISLVLKSLDIDKVQGVLFDLGVSSNQIDCADRGFSFQNNGPLDMRMDNSHGETLQQWLTEATIDEMIQVLKKYGEERYAKSIAMAIKRAMPLQDTKSLANVIEKARPYSARKHAATRSFQAFRIAVNRELESLQIALDTVVDVLSTGARLVVISFHSLEDRIVKRCIARHLGTAVDVSIPTMEWLVAPVLKKLVKAKPSNEEIAKNNRARSAIMRVAEKLSVSEGLGLAT